MKTTTQTLTGSLTRDDKTRVYRIFRAGIQSGEFGKKKYEVIRDGRILNITITRLSPVYGEPEGYVTTCQLELSKHYYNSNIRERKVRYLCKTHISVLMRLATQLKKGHTTNNLPMQLTPGDEQRIGHAITRIDQAIKDLEMVTEPRKH